MGCLDKYEEFSFAGFKGRKENERQEVEEGTGPGHGLLCTVVAVACLAM